MRILLWPESSSEEHREELDIVLSRRAATRLPEVILVSQDDDGALTGFLEVGLRSHADGCDPSLPVGYVEGWFVRAGSRKRGIGAELMQAAENWAREQGCREIASDALIENVVSLNAHEALGFQEVDRCVHYRKALVQD